MVASTTSPLVLHAEQEHPLLRYAVSLALLVVFALCFCLFYLLIRQAPGNWPSYALTFACLPSLPLTLAVVWVIEGWLKRVWPSGYQLTLDGRGVHVARPGQEPAQLPWASHTSPTAWYFPLRGYKQSGRERRVPDKWMCLACQLQYDEERVIIYTYCPPEKVQTYLDATSPIRFHRLDPAEVYERSVWRRFQPPDRPNAIPAKVLSGKDGRFWLAEQRRWTEGLELPVKEFTLFLDYLQVHRSRE